MILEGPPIKDHYEEATSAALSISLLYSSTASSIRGKNIPLKLSLYVTVLLRRHQFPLRVCKIDDTWSYVKEGVGR